MVGPSSMDLRKLSLSLASALATLGVVELAARAVYTRPWYEDIVAAARREGPREHAYKVNADGLRSSEIRPKGPGTRRVLVIGDSFTFGWAVHDDAAVFPAHLERALADERIEIVNGGLAGSLTHQWVDLWRRLGDRVDPDVVLIVFFLRDGTRTTSIGMFDAIRAELTAEHDASLLYRASAAYRTIRDRFDRRRIGEHYRAEFHAAYFGDERARAEWIAAQENLKTLIAMARGRGVAVGLAVFPVLIDLDAEAYPFEDVCEEILAFAAREEVPAMSLLPAFRGRDASTLWVSDVDQHPNADAHAIVAAALEPFVRTLLGHNPAGGDQAARAVRQ